MLKENISKKKIKKNKNIMTCMTIANKSPHVYILPISLTVLKLLDKPK